VDRLRRQDRGRGPAPEAPKGTAKGPARGPGQRRLRPSDVRDLRDLELPARPPYEPPQKRAFSTLVGPVDAAGDPSEAAALRGLFEVDPALDRALTHGFHSYAGRLHPSIARGAIARWSPAGGVVLDPFCGSGTVLVEGLIAGRRATGIDASPLAVAIARVRTNPLDAAKRAALVECAREIAEDAGTAAKKRIRPELPRFAAEEMEHFHPHVAFELFTLRALVMDLPEDPVGQALRLCLSSMLVKFMRSGPAAPRDGAEKRIARGLPSRFFADRAAELAAGLEELERRKAARVPPARVFLGDARSYPDIKAGSVDLIVSSPPYAGVYDYAEHHAVRFRWLGLPMEDFRRRQLGDRAVGVGAATKAWREGRRQWLVEMGRVLRAGGAAVLVVGDGVVGEAPEDAAKAVADDAPAAGLVYVAHASQARPTRDQRLRAIFGTEPRREHIVLLRRTDAAPAARRSG
jgi:DNA methylase